MELFLIIIIIILVYLLLRKKSSNNLKDDLNNETKKYAKAFKEAAKTFQQSVSESTNSSVENENKKIIDGFEDSVKAGIVATSEIVKRIYEPLSNEFNSKIPLEVWRDEKVAGFNAMLISYMLKNFVSEKNHQEKGLAVGLVYEFLVEEYFKSVYDDFNNIARNPTPLSTEGTNLANLLIDIITDSNLKYRNVMDETNSLLKEALLKGPIYADKFINFGEDYDNFNAEVATALLEDNLFEYILKKHKN
jgi:hypothetical protein